MKESKDRLIRLTTMLILLSVIWLSGEIVQQTRTEDSRMQQVLLWKEKNTYDFEHYNTRILMCELGITIDAFLLLGILGKKKRYEEDMREVSP